MDHTVVLTGPQLNVLGVKYAVLLTFFREK